MPRIQRTIDELHADSGTLLYEFEMLCGTAARLTTLDRNQQRIAYNSTIESFAIHCRALVAFFFDHTPQHDTDVVATDFFFEPGQWANLHSIDNFFHLAKIQANKQIAHITTERRNLNTATGKNADWQVSEIVREICKLMSSFLALVPTQNVDSAVKLKLLELLRIYATSIHSAPVMKKSLRPSGIQQQNQSVQQNSAMPIVNVGMTGKTCP